MTAHVHLRNPEPSTRLAETISNHSPESVTPFCDEFGRSSPAALYGVLLGGRR